MIMPIKKSEVDIKNKYWKDIEKIIQEPTSIMVWGDKKTEPVSLLAFGVHLLSKGYSVVRHHVYHTCQEEAVDIRDLSEGFEDPNKICSVCKKRYEDDIRYDTEIIIKYPIELID